MADQALPQNTFVVITTGAEAKFYRNQGQSGEISLKAVGDLLPKKLAEQGPSGKQPSDS